MADSAEGAGDRGRPGAAPSSHEPRRAQPGRGSTEAATVGDPQADDSAVDLRAARPTGQRGSRLRRAADRATAAHRPGVTSPRRPIEPMIVALVAVVGLVAALAGGLLAGAGGAALAGGAAVGLVVGAVLGIVCSRLADGSHPIAPAAPPANAGFGRPGPSRSPGRGGAVPPAGRGGDDGNLGPLLASIGHRYQVLADRQLAALAALAPTDGGRASGGAGERADPAGRDEVLATGRLARRIRRMAKTLQVLADDHSSWEAAAPATIDEVVGAAVADIDDRARVEGGSLHAATVEGEAVPDVVHLLAELIENAVAASAATSSRVVVLGRRSAEGYVVSVMDEGTGMTDAERAQANIYLHTPPPLHQVPSSLGLATAGRLAARHGIGVTLLEAPTDGVIAKVRLPARLLGGAPPDRGGSSRPRGRPVIDLTADAEESRAPLRADDAPAGDRDRGEPGASAAGEETVADRPGRRGDTCRGDDEPLASAAEARADLSRRVQRSRPVPREVAPLRRDQRPVDAGHRPERPPLQGRPDQARGERPDGPGQGPPTEGGGGEDPSDPRP